MTLPLKPLVCARDEDYSRLAFEAESRGACAVGTWGRFFICCLLLGLAAFGIYSGKGKL